VARRRRIVERVAVPSVLMVLMTQMPMKDRHERVGIPEALQRLGVLGEHHVVPKLERVGILEALQRLGVLGEHHVVPKLDIGEPRVAEMGAR